MSCASTLQRADTTQELVLGQLYEFGRAGVALNYAQALVLCRLAAAQNFVEAQLILGGASHLDSFAVLGMLAA